MRQATNRSYIHVQALRLPLLLAIGKLQVAFLRHREAFRSRQDGTYS